MSLLEKLKSLFGSSDDESESSKDVSVTVERERGDAADSSDTMGTDTTEAGSEQPDISESETPDTEAEPETGGSESGTPVDKIKGVGPTYADRLADAGIESVEQLAEADAESLADKTEISETRLQNWIDQAKVR